MTSKANYSALLLRLLNAVAKLEGKRTAGSIALIGMWFERRIAARGDRWLFPGSQTDEN